jgi:hypothetical protein
MRFDYAGNDKGLVWAAEYCNQLLGREEFWTKVVESGPYDFTAVSPEDIASFARSYNGVCRIQFFTGTIWRFNRTVAYVSPDRRDTIFVNTKYLKNSVAQKVNTLTHEYVHVTDYFGDHNARIDYGHGSQTASGKGRSAPYAIGDIAEAFYKAENPGFLKSFIPGELNFECDLGVMPEELIVPDV